MDMCRQPVSRMPWVLPWASRILKEIQDFTMNMSRTNNYGQAERCHGWCCKFKYRALIMDDEARAIAVAVDEAPHTNERLDD
ncbi:unnamed protein product [Trichogramma brassicae]|uniref:Uncharacterized protein n=1 Tax=Trichogramma brassicae TaxID=86971 RepID=A0A6H5HZZ2_9HYME|nr:unnamed protein product [Trichogramma brassicae]